MLDGEIIAAQARRQSALYDGVRTRRVLAFLIDYLIVALLLIPFAILVFFLGLLTLGLGWMLFGVLVPGGRASSMSGTRSAAPKQATTGMQMMGIRLDRLDGRPVDGLLAVVHSVLFWAGNVVLTPLILLATLLLDRKRTAARPAARHGRRRAPTAERLQRTRRHPCLQIVESAAGRYAA